MLTDDAEMRALNRTWRGKDSSTNVLSFPAGYAPGAIAGEPRPLGDVVLAAETVLAEAADRHIPAADHAAHLVVHGMLHLLGFDHERDEDAEAMEASGDQGALHDSASPIPMRRTREPVLPRYRHEQRPALRRRASGRERSIA